MFCSNCQKYIPNYLTNQPFYANIWGMGYGKRMGLKTEKPIRRISRRNVGNLQVLQLYVAAGGRCEFPGCPNYLLSHPLTKRGLNHGEVAHIVAFSRKGPRGNISKRPAHINSVDNLMLLCGSCHKLVDQRRTEFPIQLLRKYKAQHEAQVRQAIEMVGVESKRTSIVRFVAPIGSAISDIPLNDARRALFPKIASDRPCDISLNEMHGIAEGSIYEQGAQLITTQFRGFLATASREEPIQHFSIFGLGPIPLLVHLGFTLGRNIPADVYNRQHQHDDWTWQTRAPTHDFDIARITNGSTPDSVAFLLSCSGQVNRDSLPLFFDDRFTIYEIKPRGCIPSKNVLRNPHTLEAFKSRYEEFRRTLAQSHRGIQTLHLFPAVPPAIAITLGRELIEKVDPKLRIYDWRRNEFVYALEVNKHD